MVWGSADIDIRHLRVFVTIVEAGGFTQAQLVLGLSQSTISNQIGSLEESLGFRLCERGRSGFRLTLKGEVVYQSAVELFGVLNNFHEGMSGLKKVMLGRLRIGLLSGVSLTNIAAFVKAIGTYNRIAPDVAIEITRHRQDELEHALLKGNLDIAVGGQPPNEDFALFPLGSIRYRLATAIGHPLATVDNIDRLELLKHRFVSSSHLATAERTLLPDSHPAVLTSDLDEKLALMRASPLFGYLPSEDVESIMYSDIRFVAAALDLRLPITLFRRKNRGNRIVRTFYDCVLGKFSDTGDATTVST